MSAYQREIGMPTCNRQVALDLFKWFFNINLNFVNLYSQVKSDEQMIYQIMYPIIENAGTIDGQHLAAKQTTVDANVLTTSTCTVLTPAKNIPKKHIINSYTIIEKQNQYTNTEAVPVTGSLNMLLIKLNALRLSLKTFYYFK